jgi:circadian clock protein KaiB
MAMHERKAAMKTGKRRVAKKKRAAKKKAPVWELRLYVADTTARSVLATENLQSLCEQYLSGQYRLTIIDLVKKPELAREHEIMATPTLVRVFPGPEKTVIGSLSDTARVLRALELGNQPEKLVSDLSRAGVQVGSA